MKLKCLLGLHAWCGCKCSVCGAIRDKDHRWQGCRCQVCNGTRSTGHDFRNGCTCVVCGVTNHVWDKPTGKCSRCGCGARIISSLADFDGMRRDLGGFYRLEVDIDASTPHFRPIGDEKAPFSGSFDGNGHIVRLRFDVPDAPHAMSLFGVNAGLISGVTVECALSGGAAVAGGLVGQNAHSGHVSRCNAHGSIDGRFVCAGGLVGLNEGTVELCASDSRVNSSSTLGTAGGLVGQNTGKIVKSYAQGSASRALHAGRLAGAHTGTIDECYATTALVVPSTLGRVAHEGLVACRYDPWHDPISRTLPENTGVISRSYWLVSEVSQSLFGGGIVLESPDKENGVPAQSDAMKRRATYEGWDFVETWVLDEGQSFPRLRCLTEQG